MQTKTYFASSVPAALDVARKELGSEAMLLNSKPAPAETRAFGRLEVTFAYEARRGEDALRTEPRVAKITPKLAEPFAPPEYRQGRGQKTEPSELDDLRRQIEALRSAVGAGQGANPANRTNQLDPQEPNWGSGPAEHEPETRRSQEWSRVMASARGQSGFQAGRTADENAVAVARLVRNGVSESLARELADSAANRAGDRASRLVEEIVSRIPVAPFGEMKPGETRVLAFLGPAGRGKTTSLVKIAVKYGLAGRIPVRIYQAGGHGVGCQEQMARYAAILGVPFLACESLESLNLSLAGDGWKGLVLIDTPGISPSSSAELQELGKLFYRQPEIERHLVLRADTRSADMSYVVSKYSALGPARLLFTGVEETLSTGAMVETLITTGLGSSFSGIGQQIPDDMEELDIPRLARSVCGERAMAASAGL